MLLSVCFSLITIHLIIVYSKIPQLSASSPQAIKSSLMKASHASSELITLVSNFNPIKSNAPTIQAKQFRCRHYYGIACKIAHISSLFIEIIDSVQL